MSQYQNLRNAYCNQEKVRFPGTGLYEVPVIRPEDLALDGLEFVRFDDCMRIAHPEDKVVHFFMDDYVFDRVWRSPERYARVLRQFRALVAPDYSLYSDHPRIVQQYNHFRKHWLAAYWQSIGLTVIPCIRWVEHNPGSLAWCLDGEPRGSTVCVSTQGGVKGQWRKDDFLYSLQTAVDILQPSRLILFGPWFPGLHDLNCPGDVVHVESDLMRRRAGSMGASSSGSRGGVRDNSNWEDNAPAGYMVLHDQDVDEKMSNAKWEKHLSEDERSALRRYTSTDDVAGIINRQARAGLGREYKATVAGLESALDRGYVKQNTVLHRVSTPDLLGGAATVSDIRKLFGQVVSDQGFTSASATPNSDKYPQLAARMAYHIKVPQGRGIGAFVKGHSEYGWENEFLFNRGSAFRVEGAWEDRDGLVHVNLAYVGRNKR